MDQYYKELRDMKDKTVKQNKEVMEAYKKLREQYKASVQENLKIGSLKPLEELLPSERQDTRDTRGKPYKPASNLTQKEVSLAKTDCEAIDKLFKGFDEKPN